MNNLTEKQQNQVNYILDEFDFEKVHRVMEFMEWEWVNCGPDGLFGTPTIGDLRRTARRLLIGAIKGYTKKRNEDPNAPEFPFVNATGGFYATYEYGDVNLKFILEDWDAYDDMDYDELTLD